MRKTKHKPKSYADGGKVLKDYSESSDRKRKRKPKPKPSDLGSGLASGAADALRNRRRQQMKDLGI